MLAKKLSMILALAFPLVGYGIGPVRGVRAPKLGDGTSQLRIDRSREIEFHMIP